MNVTGPELALSGGSLAYLFAHSEDLGVLIAAFVPVGYLFLAAIKVISGELLKWRRPNASQSRKKAKSRSEKEVQDEEEAG